MTEPAVDLGIVLAIVSSFRNIPVSDKLMVFGEVGLSGEVRAVSQAEQRVQEAKKLGFEAVILPKANLKNCRGIEGIRLLPAENLRGAIAALGQAEK